MHRALSLLLFVLLTSVAGSAARQNTTYSAPRTEHGRPDLQGVWNFDSRVPLQRPVAFAGRKFLTREEADAERATMRNAFATLAKLAPVEAVGLDWFDSMPRVEDLRTSLISYPDNGRLPALVQGVRRMPGVEDFLAALGGNTTGGPPASLASLLAAFGGGKKDSYLDFSMPERCLVGPAVPFVPQPDGNFVQIVQARDHIALVTDFFARIVTVDVTSPAEDLRSWSGTSRGRWEGETLVVETRNFNGRRPSFAGAGNSGDKVVTERFTRTSRDLIEYAATVVDPKTFQDRVELSFPMSLVDARIHEGTCHEGNYSLRNALSGARKEEETAKSQ